MRKRRNPASLLSLLLCLIPLATASAATVLQEVRNAALPGNQVRVDLILSGPIKPPQAFATENPARIALDLKGVTSGLDKKRIPVDTGPVQSLVAVEASDRTRVVINLNESVPYQVSTSGNTISIALNSPEPPPASAPPDSTPPPVAATPPGPEAPTSGGIKNIEFKRGPNGEGRVLITLPSPNTRVSVTEKGKHVVAEIAGARLPSELLRRLDVTEFSTPVVAVESRPKGGDVQVDIETGSGYEYLAYQADELFTLEFRPPAKPEPVKKKKKRESYGGDRLSLNFQDIEVRAVLQLLADFTGLNLVASDTVKGNITLRLKNVPWDQALDIILKSKGLTKRQSGNVIMVGPTDEIVGREKEALEAQQTFESLAPLMSEFIQINYAKAEKIAALLKGQRDAVGEVLQPGRGDNLTLVTEDAENRILSERGSVTADPRTNSLLVTDTAKNIVGVRALISKLDKPVRQVMIESRVVIANNDFARDLGVRFGASKYTNSGFDSSSGALEGNIDADDQGVYSGYQVNDTIPLLVDLPVIAPSGGASFLLGKIGSYLLQLELTAMQREGRGEIVSSPRVVTSDNKQAVIRVGQEIPYQESSQNSVTNTVAFKEAALVLDVTPQITPDNRIIMKLKVNKDNPDYTNSINGVPPIDTRSVDTNVLVDNGETVVLGGVNERERTFQKEQVPWLGDLPVLGNLFKTTNRRDNNSELLIFVTPKILKEGVAGR